MERIMLKIVYEALDTDGLKKFGGFFEILMVEVVLITDATYDFQDELARIKRLQVQPGHPPEGNAYDPWSNGWIVF